MDLRAVVPNPENEAMSNLCSFSYRRIVSAVVCASAACALFVQPAHAQSKPFRLLGVISDLEETPLEGVRVELVDDATESSTSVTTDARGRFELKVPAGRYRTRVSYRELEITSTEGVDLLSGESMTFDLSLLVNPRARAPHCFSAACVDRLPGIAAPHRSDAR